MTRTKIKYDMTLYNLLNELDINDFERIVNEKYFGYDKIACLKLLKNLYLNDVITMYDYEKNYFKFCKKKKIKELTPNKRALFKEFFSNNNYINLQDCATKNGYFKNTNSYVSDLLNLDFKLYCDYIKEVRTRELRIVNILREIELEISNNSNKYIDSYYCYIKTGIKPQFLRTFIGQYDDGSFEHVKNIFLGEGYSNTNYMYNELANIAKQRIGCEEEYIFKVISFMENNNIPADIRIYNALYKRFKSNIEPFDSIVLVMK